MNLCPCGSFLPDVACCRPIVYGDAQAQTAVALMRSRYSAFYWAEVSHLNRTQRDRESIGAESMSRVEWLGLRILSIEKGSGEHDTGMVEFEARYREKGREKRLLERSAFRKIEGAWMYVGLVKT